MPHTPARIAYRYLSGRPLDGVARTDAGYLRPGRKALTKTGHASPWARLPGWQRQAVRLGVPSGMWSGSALFDAYPQVMASAAVIAGTTAAFRGVRRARRSWRTRRFRSTYVTPTRAALTMAVGDAPVRLQVSPELGNLMVRLAKPMSPAEERWRRRYGQHVEPLLRWTPEQLQRGMWALQRAARPLTRHLDDWRRPTPADAGPRIELQVSVPYLTPEQRHMATSIIGEKIPGGDLNPAVWDQVGTQVKAMWTVRRRPPARVGYADLAARYLQLQEWEFFAGLGVAGKPVVINLKTDSPHFALSAGTGAGKSVFAQVVAVQVLARGGHVVILDRKGSHRWALGLPGVDYCTTAAQMHAALLGLAALADERNTLAFHEAEDWDPGPRHLVIAEELNATIGQLRAYWESVRAKGEPKTSPAIAALADLLFMGRAAKVNVGAIAQMLTARAIGGPEARENFGVRCLARYTRNNWQMLVPEAPMPRSSRTLGRWQVVIGGEVSETQVCYLSTQEARIFVHKHRPPVHMNQGVHVDIPGQRLIKSERGHVDEGPSPTLTLQDSIDEGMCPWTLTNTQKKLQRARERKSEHAPTPVGKRPGARADLYERQALIAWIESELVPSA